MQLRRSYLALRIQAAISVRLTSLIPPPRSARIHAYLSPGSDSQDFLLNKHPALKQAGFEGENRSGIRSELYPGVNLSSRKIEEVKAPCLRQQNYRSLRCKMSLCKESVSKFH